MGDWDSADTLFLLMLLMCVAVMTYGGEPVLYLDPAIFTVDNK